MSSNQCRKDISEALNVFIPRAQRTKQISAIDILKYTKMKAFNRFDARLYRSDNQILARLASQRQIYGQTNKRTGFKASFRFHLYACKRTFWSRY